MRRLLKPVLFAACLVPLAWMSYELGMGRIRGEWIKDITHRTGFWGLVLITATLAVTPLRRLTGWNQLQSYRRMLGLFGFFYICVHFLVIYVILDKQVPWDPAFAWQEIVKDIAKRPYITVGFTGFVLMIPLALTSTRGWVRRLGRRWVTLHALIYLTALAGVVHFTWAVKADTRDATIVGVVLLILLGARLVPKRRKRAAVAPTGAAAAAAD